MSRRVLSFPLPVETDKCVFPPFRIYDDIAIEGNCFFFHVLDGKRKPCSCFTAITTTYQTLEEEALEYHQSREEAPLLHTPRSE